MQTIKDKIVNMALVADCVGDVNAEDYLLNTKMYYLIFIFAAFVNFIRSLY